MNNVLAFDSPCEPPEVYSGIACVAIRESEESQLYERGNEAS